MVSIFNRANNNQPKPTVKYKKGKNILNKTSGTEKIIFGIMFVIFAVYAISLLFPFYFLFISTLKDMYEYGDDVAAGLILALPDKWIFQNFVEVFLKMEVVISDGTTVHLLTMVFNSLWQTFTSIICGLTASAMVAYSMSKYRFGFRPILNGIIIFNMTIPIIGSSGSLFKLCLDLGIYNTPWHIILNGFGGFGFNYLILYGFFNNISWNYAEAVFIDGGSHFTAFTKIMLPQAFPPMVTLAIMSFMGSWNDYMSPLLYMPDYPTVASGIYLASKSLIRKGNYPLYYGALFLSCLPIMVLFITFSDMIMKNFTVGGLKG